MDNYQYSIKNDAVWQSPDRVVRGDLLQRAVSGLETKIRESTVTDDNGAGFILRAC
jgi:hypothetical protein